ncbi:ABC transporter ATP-binding protein [Amaricoccus sp.]|uniref:ABC transporter ATP-binding protein n=1 Tax=Amaricoccus sp. TaxID=1872485 RepID=UPI0026051448|nr:ABC transporter ATP-binding protein [Amaricoccus sp.]HRO12278.1 ABC transporter ATP-binding protein [Amaricoccus sp.]
MRLNGIRHGYGGARVLDSVSLDLRAGEVTCLLGPSGCGKSTLLRIAAGVERQDAGRVEVGGRPVSDGARHLPPEARGVGLMFQDFALFPHLSVERNVGFGLTGPPAGRARRVQQMLARVGLSRHAGKYPHQLSGGEQQRVALARALAPRPPILLMDEPFSGLDERLRDGIRDETLAILKEEGAAVLLVTHEPDEAMRMADEIALMREGRLVQQGRPYVIYNNPVDRAAAEFFSEVNVIRATVAATVAGAAAGTPFGRFDTPDLGEGAEVEIVVRPHHLRLDLDRNGRGPAPSAANGAAALGRVRRARFVGSESVVELALDQDGTLLKATVPGVFLPRPGTSLWLSLRRDRCFVFPAPRH